MKRLILILIIAVSAGMAPFAASANTENLDDIFTEFSDAENANVVNVNSFMMWLGRQIVGNDPDTEIMKKIKSVRVLELGGCDSSIKAKFKERVGKLSLKGYEEMVRSNADGEKVLVFAKMGKDSDTIHQMVIVSAGADDCALVEVNGKFKMSDMTDVINSQTSKRDGRR